MTEQATALAQLSGPLAFTDESMEELQSDFDALAAEALEARIRRLPLSEAVRQPENFPELAQFHTQLRDALFLEIPRDMQGWVESIQEPTGAQSAGVPAFFDGLMQRASGGEPEAHEEHQEQLEAALAELLLFQSVRLRLQIAAWGSEEFEALGGREEDVDAIAWAEVEALLHEPSLFEGGVRPLSVMSASAHVALARDAAERAEDLRQVGEDEREQLRMRARLRQALRELRLPESVLLENALANLLGEDRLELDKLQRDHDLALAGLSRQAMDQRVSRGRRALARTKTQWPSRRRPAIYDLVRAS